MSLRTTAALVLAAVGFASTAHADEVKVFSSVAMRAVLEELAPRFERETQHHIVATFGLAAQLKARIESGEAYDVAILTPAQIDDLVAKGKAAGASRAVIARTGLGLMVKSGAPKLDVATVEAFKQTLLSAQSLTYVPAGASRPPSTASSPGRPGSAPDRPPRFLPGSSPRRSRRDRP